MDFGSEPEALLSFSLRDEKTRYSTGPHDKGPQPGLPFPGKNCLNRSSSPDTGELLTVSNFDDGLRSWSIDRDLERRVHTQKQIGVFLNHFCAIPNVG